MQTFAKRLFCQGLVVFFAITLLITPAIGAEDLPVYAKTPKISFGYAGYAAKIMCSAVFVSQRDPESILKSDLQGFPFKPVIDYDRKMVIVSPGLGMPDQIAVFREGLGCTRCTDLTLEHVLSQDIGDPTPMPTLQAQKNLLWPKGENVNTVNLPPEVDKEKLEAAVTAAFEEPNPKTRRNTRAVVVVYKDKIVAEKYGPGITKDTPLIGWSMTKSITNALIGILAGQGRLSIKNPASVPEWSAKDDPRSSITLDHLLRMSSGLGFVEVYTDMLSDTPWMLFGEPDTAGFTASFPLEAEPDSRWRYISGSPNLVCRVMREAVGGSLTRYFSFPRRALFDKIGMRSAVIEPDVTGTFVGSSFSYATARDWARFGLLYLNDGVWEGERILPEGWVKYSTTPTPKAPKGEYGAYWWLNAGAGDDEENRRFPGLPKDLYFASGYEGQEVFVIPSRNIVLVHLGLAVPPSGDESGWNPAELVAGVLGAIK